MIAKFKYQIIITLFLAFACCILTAQDAFNLSYDAPAEKWVEALPVGNGRLGAMVYGGVLKEQLQFNEETLWAGKPHNYAHQSAGEHLAEIRQLLTAGQQIEAQNLATDKFMSVPLRQTPYQPFGDVYMEFDHDSNYTNYKRILDLATAMVKISYQVEEVEFSRTVFSSFPDQVLVVHVTASQAKALAVKLSMDALHADHQITTGKNGQTLEVKVKDGALRGVASYKIDTDGQLKMEGSQLGISEASWATLYLSAATNYQNYKDVSGDPGSIVQETLAQLKGQDYDELKQRHIEDYSTYYQRFSINLGDTGRSEWPTDRRISEFREDPDDPQLVALYVQYARYLLLASSRPGTKPANLQGIWNHKLKPPWFSSYTTNINLEMNYWPAEMTNLSECHEPLFSLIKDISETGKSVAKEHYNSEGWIAHHNIDIWRGAAPVNASHHGIWLGAGAWLSLHIWEHYLFTLDKDFLQAYFRILKQAALFYAQVLYKDPRTGYLISSPSNSPEIGGLVAGPTMDHQLIRALFRAVIAAAKVLEVEEGFSEKLAGLIPQIAPNQIGKHGQLQEWLEDKDDPGNHHRHVSHLWAVHPGNEINWDDTPELMKAARQSLEYRGDHGTGWSLAWKINFWTRFLDGNRAYKLLHRLLSPAEVPGRKVGGGSYPNLFDAHPPFQIDGNFGGTAGILEMFVQSHLGKIDILPALPDALPNGKISGLMARGGFELSLEWKDSKLLSIELLSKKGQECRLTYQGKSIVFATEEGSRYSFNGELE